MAYISKITLPSGDTYDLKANDMINPNLLINPDFKINQRGQTRYTPTTSNIYSVDRWRVSVGYWCTYDNDAKALAVVCGTPKVNSWTLVQRIENYEDLKGKTVTFSVHCSADTDCYTLLIYDGKTQSSTAIPFAVNQTVSLTHTVSADATQLNVAICTNGQEETNALIYLKWAKLEVGSVATPFVPPNPSTELIKCQRYYFALNMYNKGSLSATIYGGTVSAMYVLPTKLYADGTYTTVTISDNGIVWRAEGLDWEIIDVDTTVTADIIKFTTTVTFSNTTASWSNLVFCIDAEMY